MKSALPLQPQQKLVDKVFFDSQFEQEEKREEKLRQRQYPYQNLNHEIDNVCWNTYDEFFLSKFFVLTFQPEQINEKLPGDSSDSDSVEGESDMDWNEKDFQDKFHQTQAAIMRGFNRILNRR